MGTNTRLATKLFCNARTHALVNFFFFFFWLLCSKRDDDADAYSYCDPCDVVRWWQEESCWRKEESASKEGAEEENAFEERVQGSRPRHRWVLQSRQVQGWSQGRRK